jgi:hypothetical protein
VDDGCKGERRENKPTHCTISYHLWKRCCQLLNILYIHLSSEIIW